MTEHVDPGALPDGQPEPTGVTGLARRVLEVYQGADEDLQHAVHDCLQVGMPGSVLLGDEPGVGRTARAADESGSARPSGQVPQKVR
jgi:hypothetical protein